MTYEKGDELLMNTIINLVELYALVWVVWKAFRLFTGKRGKKDKSIANKIFTLTSRGINRRLDVALKKQKKSGIKSNVIEFKRARG